MIKPFNKKNVGSYIRIILVYIIVSLFLSFVAWNYLYKNPSFISYFIFALTSVMAGMMILFIASLLNLRKLLPAFEEMAEGNTKVYIPPVWCPVLTSASQAAKHLCNSKEKKQGK